MFISQILGLIEIIPTAYAITAIEDSLDEPIPLESINEEDEISVQRTESDFYYEIPDNIIQVAENPSLLPEWANKQTFELIGLFVGFLGGLAARTYFFAISPNAGFNCTAYQHTVDVVTELLNNLN